MSEDNQNSRINQSNISDYSSLGKQILIKKNETKSDLNSFTINDLNNYVGANRKLVINDTYEFWVHDAILIENSKYFGQLFKGKKLPTREEKIKLGSNDITKTFIDVPHPEYFFDILTWIYSKDSHRLSCAADEPESFLSILSLGIHLELCDGFFTSMLTTCDIQLDENLIQNTQWSRFCFTFEVLVNLIELMPKESFLLKVCALLSWLKEDNTLKLTSEDDYINERELELLTSKEFFMVKDFVNKNKIEEKMTIADLGYIKCKYPFLVPIFDIDYLINKYIENSKMKISCKICGKKGTNIQEFASIPCEIKLYHPRSFVMLQRQLTSKCEHEDCKKKLAINEFPCCHKASHVDGCLLSDGNHLLQFE